MARKPDELTSSVDIVTPNDRPVLVRNHGVIENFDALLCFVALSFLISIDVGNFVKGLSQICSLCFVLQLTFLKEPEKFS